MAQGSGLDLSDLESFSQKAALFEAMLSFAVVGSESLRYKQLEYKKVVESCASLWIDEERLERSRQKTMQGCSGRKADLSFTSKFFGSD